MSNEDGILFAFIGVFFFACGMAAHMIWNFRRVQREGLTPSEQAEHEMMLTECGFTDKEIDVLMSIGRK